MPSHYAVRISKTASSDLDAIFSYIVKQSPQNAERVLQRLLDEIFALKMLPHRYKVHKRSHRPDQVVRSMPVPPFVVYYRVIEDPRVVRVLTVRHGARRKPRHFE